MEPKSGGELAGLKPFGIGKTGEILRLGDIIVGVDDLRVRTFDECAEALRRRRTGAQIALTVVRGMPDAPKVEKLNLPLARSGN